MATTLELQRRGLPYAVVVDAAVTNADLLDLQRKGLAYRVAVADGASKASLAALDARGLTYFVPVAVDATPASKASLAAQGLRYAVKADAAITAADMAALERQGLPYFVQVDSSGNSVSPISDVGGSALLTGETDGLGVDFTYATDGNRVAKKVASVKTEYGLDSFFTNAGTSPKYLPDVTGAYVWSPHNMALQSQDFSQSTPWNLLSNLTVTTNATTAPDGTLTADRIVEVANTSNHAMLHSNITTISGLPYTFSVYAKAGERNWIAIAPANQAPADWFNLTTGTVGTTANGGAISDAGNGWYRCSITQVAPATTRAIYIYLRTADGQTGTYAGSTSNGLYLWGAQVNRGATPVAYVATTTAVRAGLAVDYDLTSHAAKGLLVEPAATNILLNNATLSTQSVSSAAQQYTLSFWGTGTITLTGTSTAGPLVGTGASNRVSLTFQPTAGTLTLTVSGTVTNAQLEQNAVATSLIPVLGVAVTRTADAVTVATSAFPWAAAAANSIVVQAASLVPASATYLNLHDGTDAERHVIDTNAGAKQGRYLVTDGSAAQADIGAVAAAVAGTYYKVGAAAAANDAATCVNGGTVATDATVTLPTVTTLTLGGSRATPGGNVYIKTLKIVPRRMTNPELVTATT